MTLLIALMLAANPTPPFTAATCEDARAREALLASADRDGEPAFAVAMRERSAEREKKMDVLLGRLAERAGLSDTEKAGVALGLLDAPGFQEAMQEGLSLLTAMMGGLGRIAKSKDDRQSCLIVVEMFDKLPLVEANAARQWTIMEQALEAEAKKRGVSLAP